MADYKGIQGFSVQSLASDPPASIGLGQLWYNSASNVWKIGAVGAGAWASGGNKNNYMSGGMGCGTQTAALAATGTGGTGPTPGNQNLCEEYNGTGWAEVNVAPTAVRVCSGGGIQTSAIVAGGYSTTYMTESFTYDGTNWTEVADINTAREGAAGAASASTAAIIAGGEGPNSISPRTTALTEEYNGTSWTEKADLTTARTLMAGIGTVTAALAVGGYIALGNTEEWDGTSWSEVNDLTTARNAAFKMGAGSTTSAMIVGGMTGPVGSTDVTEVYNGTCWTEVADLATSRTTGYGGGTQALGIAGGGYQPSNAVQIITEEWNGAPEAVQTVTTS